METINFTAANPEDAGALRPLASKSEAHWGYNNTFMDIFDREFNITQEFIKNNPVYVSWNGKMPMAFWGLMLDTGCSELEYFYVSEEALGTGVGRQMWNHMISWCRKEGIKKLHFVTSPQAVGFYEKVGAIQSGTTESTIDHRQIPQFLYEI